MARLDQAGASSTASPVLNQERSIVRIQWPRQRGSQRSALPANWVSGAPLPARILIVDDNSVVRTTIRSFLNWHSLRVCGEAADGKEAIQKVRELKPDIVLLDINMPGMNGVKTAYEIRRVSPRTKIVFLTVHNTPGTINAARMWVDGFVPKSTAGTVLIPTLSRVSEMLGYRPYKRSKARRAAAP
jgi:CheY-like chemotaxis protein